MPASLGTLIERVRALLTAKTAADQLDEVRAKLREATAELGRLDEQIARRALPILRGDTEAARVAVDLEHEKRAVAAEIAILRNGESQLAATVAAEERAEAQAAAARMPRQVAEKVAATLDVDDEIHRLAAALAAAIRVRKQAGLDLAQLAGGAQLRNLNSGAAGRIRDSIARYFQDPGHPRTPMATTCGS